MSRTIYGRTQNNVTNLKFQKQRNVVITGTVRSVNNKTWGWTEHVVNKKEPGKEYVMLKEKSLSKHDGTRY